MPKPLIENTSSPVAVAAAAAGAAAEAAAYFPPPFVPSLSSSPPRPFSRMRFLRQHRVGLQEAQEQNVLPVQLLETRMMLAQEPLSYEKRKVGGKRKGRNNRRKRTRGREMGRRSDSSSASRSRRNSNNQISTAYHRPRIYTSYP